LKDKAISEDEDHRAQAIIQKTTDDYIAQVDSVSAAKEKDLLEM
jgi:ribosome recycling factor